MGRGARAWGGAVALVCLLASSASADPLKVAPERGKVQWGDPDAGFARAGLVLEMRAVGVLGARRLTTWPDRQLGLEGGVPQLVGLDAGVVGTLRCAPISFALRLDLAEPMRPLFTWDEPGVVAGAVVDDAWIWWQPWRPLGFLVGRARVPWSTTRQWDDADEPLGAPPFLVDRVAPDRRWGLALLGDLGAMSYAGGIWADLDAIDPRSIPADVSTGGLLAAGGQVEWTPIAPMYGSNPVGKVRGAFGPLPTPRSDPWYATARVSLGLGTLWRLSEDGDSRVDLSFSGHAKWRWTAVLGEVLFAPEGFTGAHVSLMATPVDHLSITLRGELDDEAGGWTASAGALWHVTRDRKNKLGFVGWFREGERGRRLDGAVAYLQASL